MAGIGTIPTKASNTEGPPAQVTKHMWRVNAWAPRARATSARSKVIGFILALVGLRSELISSDVHSRTCIRQLAVLYMNEFTLSTSVRKGSEWNFRLLLLVSIKKNRRCFLLTCYGLLAGQDEMGYMFL